jgi:hypothetical protein
VRVSYIHPGDIVEVSKGGRRFHGLVAEISDGLVRFEPLCRGISYRHATAREVVRHWRRTGRGGPTAADEPGADQPARDVPGQLSLPVWR